MFSYPMTYSSNYSIILPFFPLHYFITYTQHAQGETINKPFKHHYEKEKKYSKGLRWSAPDKLKAFDSRRSTRDVRTRAASCEVGRDRAGPSEPGSAAARVVFVPSCSSCSLSGLCVRRACVRRWVNSREKHAPRRTCFAFIHLSAVIRVSHQETTKNRPGDTRRLFSSLFNSSSFLVLHGGLSTVSQSVSQPVVFSAGRCARCALMLRPALEKLLAARVQL